MRLTYLAFVLPLLLLCACPQRRAGEAPAEGPADPAPGSAATAPGAGSVATADQVQIWHDPVLGEPLRAYAKQAFVVLAEELALQEADLEAISALADAEPDARPQIVIFGYAPALPELAAAGVVAESTARTFAGDRLVLAEKQGTGYTTPTLFDTYRLRFDKLGYLAESAALGKPSRQALVADGLLARIEERTVEYQSLRELFGALLEDAVQLALVPASLATQSNSIEPVLIVGEDLHEDIRYIAAATAGNEDDAVVLSVLRMLAEDEELQRLFIGYGLLGREAALIED